MNIAICDINAIVTNTLEDFLSNLGHRVSVFSSIDDMLASGELRTNGPDVVIVDLDMPAKMAVVAARSIHERFSESFMVVMSKVLPVEEAMASGVFSYLNKPVFFAQLELIISRIAERMANRDETMEDNLGIPGQGEEFSQ